MLMPRTPARHKCDLPSIGKPGDIRYCPVDGCGRFHRSYKPVVLSGQETVNGVEWVELGLFGTWWYVWRHGLHLQLRRDGAKSEMNCEFCGEPVSTGADNAWEEVTSWVHRKKKHGATLRKYTGKVAHNECILRQKEGQASELEQPSLFDKPDLYEVTANPVDEAALKDWTGGDHDWQAGREAGWRNDELATRKNDAFMAGYDAGQLDRENSKERRGNRENDSDVF